MRLNGHGRKMLSVCPPLAKGFLICVVPKEGCAMRDTLEDLYYGDLRPNERQIAPDSPLSRALERAFETAIPAEVYDQLERQMGEGGDG